MARRLLILFLSFCLYFARYETEGKVLPVAPRFSRRRHCQDDILSSAKATPQQDSQPQQQTWLQHIPRIEWQQYPILRDRRTRLALAGALAGAFTTIFLHPIDTAKTLRQTNPEVFRSTRQAIKSVVSERGFLALYAGVGPALVGSMPSSALYFGTYESVKIGLQDFCDCHVGPRREFWAWLCRARALRHCLAAAAGNTASSLVFVPKEFLKQSMQACQIETRVCTPIQILKDTLQNEGPRGLYAGYAATLARNVPSAALRFSLYEELRRVVAGLEWQGRPVVPGAYFLVGALAGVLSSTLTTPLDVLKTQVATGRLPRGLNPLQGLAAVWAREGARGLYAGVQPRAVMSGLFTALGFGSFEAFKIILDANEPKDDGTDKCIVPLEDRERENS